MKNKYASKITQQMLHDIRTLEENMSNLANDLIRVERQFTELWTFVHKHKGELAEKPHLQMVKCDECENWTKDYQVIPDANNYVRGVICKICLQAKDKEMKEEPEII